MDRVYGAIRYAVTAIAIIMIVETVVLECIPETLLMMFNASETMMSFGVTALRFCIASLFFGGVTIVLSSKAYCTKPSTMDPCSRPNVI
jgi:Na+-driven multidrug efflux pump